MENQIIRSARVGHLTTFILICSRAFGKDITGISSNLYTLEMANIVRVLLRRDGNFKDFKTLPSLNVL